MIEEEIVNRVQLLAEPVLTPEGFELVEVVFRREARGWVLRLYVDKEGGITVDDCMRISQEIGRNLDVEDFISPSYVLEVSSPGLTRSLRTEKDFRKYQGRLVRITTRAPIGNRKHWKGRIRSVGRDQVGIEAEGEFFWISLSNIAKAVLEIEL